MAGAQIYRPHFFGEMALATRAQTDFQASNKLTLESGCRRLAFDIGKVLSEVQEDDSQRQIDDQVPPNDDHGDVQYPDPPPHRRLGGVHDHGPAGREPSIA